MGLLPDSVLRMHWECRERFPAPTGSDPDMRDSRVVVHAGIPN